MFATWARTAVTATLVVLLLTMWRGPDGCRPMAAREVTLAAGSC
jgi:hypothetical protein